VSHLAARPRRLRRVGACAVVALGVLLALPVTAPSQGCPMCRETAGFETDRAIGALKRGILTLAIPPMGIALGVAWLTWKRANRPLPD